MGIIRINGSKVINLKGFIIDGEVLLSDSDRIGNYDKVDVILPVDYLEYLVSERGLLDVLDGED